MHLTLLCSLFQRTRKKTTKKASARFQAHKIQLTRFFGIFCPFVAMPRHTLLASAVLLAMTFQAHAWSLNSDIWYYADQVLTGSQAASEPVDSTLFPLANPEAGHMPNLWVSATLGHDLAGNEVRLDNSTLTVSRPLGSELTAGRLSAVQVTGASDIGTLYLRNNTLKLSGALAEDTDIYEIATALITDQTNIDSLKASGNLLEIDQANLAYTRRGSLPDIGSFLRENLSSVTIGQLAADHNAVRITNSELSVNVFAVRASVTESAQTLDNSVVIQDSTFVGDHQFDVIAVNGLGSDTGSLASQQSSVVISNVKHDGQSFYSIAADQLQLAISVSSSDASVILDNFQTDANATGQICASNLQGRHNAEALNGTLAIRHSSVTGTLGGSLVALSLLYGDTSFGSVVAHNNALEISDSTLGENLSDDSASAYGVKATSGTPASFDLHSNRLSISDSTIQGSWQIVGASASGDIDFFNPQQSTAVFTNNSVILSNTKTQDGGADIFGILAENLLSAQAVGTTVQIADSEVSSVYGVSLDSVESAQAIGTSVQIAGSELNSVYGVRLSSVDSTSIQDTRVAVTDHSVVNTIIGVSARSSDHVDIVNTSIVIADSTVKGTVSLARLGGETFLGTSSGNTLTLSNATVGSVMGIYGDYSSQDSFGENSRLILSGNNTVENYLTHFDNVDFYVTKENASAPILTLGATSQDNLSVSTLNGNDSAVWDLSGTSVNIHVSGLNPGDSFELIDLADSQSISVSTDTVFNKSDTFTTESWKVAEDSTLSGTISSDTLKDILDASSYRKTANSNASTLSESILGSMAMINQATEFVADEGLLMAESSARSDATTLFGAMYGGKSSYDTAGDLDLDSMHLIVGASTRVSDTVLAAFFEAGWGDSDNRYATSSGNADHEYYGVGLALRHFVSDTFFLDASLHGGMSSTDYSGRFASSGATFDDNSLFAAAHLGAGMRFALTDTLMTEVYGRYALNWLSSESIRIDAADRSTLEYDDVFVHTLRFGTRLRHQLTDQFAWSAGLAYERTLQSDLKADVNNLAIDGVSLEGNTGVGELSATYRKSADSPWAASVVLKGYVGQRQGADGQVRLDYRF